MKLLLDTHVWLWAIRDPARLSANAVELLEDSDNELWISPISIWEAVLLAQKGRIEIDTTAREWILRELASFPLRDAPLTREVAIASRNVSLPHPDPADRFIVASALVHDLVLVTADLRIIESGACKLIAAA